MVQHCTETVARQGCLVCLAADHLAELRVAWRRQLLRPAAEAMLSFLE